MLLIIGVALCFTFAYVSELIGLTGIMEHSLRGFS